MSEAALFYPRMHVKDAGWLKGALLIFDEVRRMVPPHLPLEEAPDVRAFTTPHGGGRVLLSSADVYSERAYRTTERLAERIAEDARSAEFKERFGQAAARRGLSDQDLGYQIFAAKFSERLIDTLRANDLGWAPEAAESYHYWDGYLEVHPRLGEAIMSALAIACAKGEGLKIITDDRSRPLHECLVRQDDKRVYDAWVHKSDDLADPRGATGTELFETLVTIACDTSALTAQSLAEMKEDREPLRRLLAKLDDHARNVGILDNGERRQERMRDEVAKVLAEWERDRANMSPIFRRFFGMGLLDPSATFAEKVTSGLRDAAVAGAAGWTSASLMGAEYGLGIGFITHAIKSAVEERPSKRPYAMLSTMEQEGVVFRSSIDIRMQVRPSGRQGSTSPRRAFE